MRGGRTDCRCSTARPPLWRAYRPGSGARRQGRRARRQPAFGATLWVWVWWLLRRRRRRQWEKWASRCEGARRRREPGRRTVFQRTVQDRISHPKPMTHSNPPPPPPGPRTGVDAARRTCDKPARVAPGRPARPKPTPQLAHTVFSSSHPRRTNEWNPRPPPTPTPHHPQEEEKGR